VGGEGAAEPTPAATEAPVDESAPAESASVMGLVSQLDIEIGAKEGGQAVGLLNTDETGASQLIDLGTFVGACQSTARPDAEALYVVDCREGERGTRLRLIRRRDQLIVLRSELGGGEEEDYEIHRQIELRPGVTIQTAADK